MTNITLFDSFVPNHIKSFCFRLPSWLLNLMEELLLGLILVQAQGELDHNFNTTEAGLAGLVHKN